MRHADAGVEHHHDAERPHVIVEDRELLRAAVVENLEVLTRQIGDEAVGRVGHRHVRRNHPRARLEGRLLGRGSQGQQHRAGHCQPGQESGLEAHILILAYSRLALRWLGWRTPARSSKSPPMSVHTHGQSLATILRPETSKVLCAPPGCGDFAAGTRVAVASGRLKSLRWPTYVETKLTERIPKPCSKPIGVAASARAGQDRRATDAASAASRPHAVAVGAHGPHQRRARFAAGAGPVGSGRRSQGARRVTGILEDADVVLPDLLRHTAALVVEEIRALETRISAIDRQLAHVARTHPIAIRLQQIPGVGVLTATAMVGAVNHIHAFRRGREFASWLGLTPRESSTGGRRHLGASVNVATCPCAVCSHTVPAPCCSPRNGRFGHTTSSHAVPTMGGDPRRATRPQQSGHRYRQQARATDLGGVASRRRLSAQSPAPVAA